MHEAGATDLQCPICQRRFDPQDDPERRRVLPFCSSRCQHVDLARWLNEEYGLPIEPDDESFVDEDAELN